MINSVSILTGISMAYKLRIKYLISCELIQMCNLMKIELGYYINSTELIIKNLAVNSSLSHLIFLKNIDLNCINIDCGLGEFENQKLNALFNVLGNTDADSVIDVIDSVEIAFEDSKNKYYEYYVSHSKLYAAVGVFCGLAVSIILA